MYYDSALETPSRVLQGRVPGKDFSDENVVLASTSTMRSAQGFDGKRIEGRV